MAASLFSRGAVRSSGSLAFQSRRFASAAPKAEAPPPAVPAVSQPTKSAAAAAAPKSGASASTATSKAQAFTTALGLSVLGLGGGAAYWWYEQEAANASRIRGMPPLRPASNVQRHHVTGTWFEVGGVVPAWQAAWVGTQWTLTPSPDDAGRLHVEASAHLQSVLLPRVSVPCGEVQLGASPAGPLVTPLQTWLPEALGKALQPQLLVLEAGDEWGANASDSPPHWLLVVNGNDRRRAWLLSRTAFLSPAVHEAARQAASAQGVDTAAWHSTDPLEEGAQEEAAALQARAANAPSSVASLAARALHQAQASVADAVEATQDVWHSDGGASNGVRSPLQMAADSLRAVRAERAAAELQARRAANRPPAEEE
ncbi:unnamed protein product, partial [Symbiodinium sp. KB8]